MLQNTNTTIRYNRFMQDKKKQLTHIDEKGDVTMVDVGDKAITTRCAIARGSVTMQPETLQLVMEGQLKKGNVLLTAKIAGIMAAKRTADLIPLCHPLPLTKIDVSLTPNEETAAIDIEATAKVDGKTGVEMEALMAVNIAALTIYDMAKAVDQTMQLTHIRLYKKTGGKSDYLLEEA